MTQFMIQDGQQIVLDIVDQAPPAGRLLARVPVTYSDFQLARDETWLFGMREGKLAPQLESYQLRVLPGPESGLGLLDGYTVELRHESTSYRRHFDVYSLSNVAQRALANLVQEQSIELGDHVKYYLTKVPADEEVPDSLAGSQTKLFREPLVFEPARLADFFDASHLLEGVSEPPDESSQSPIPIFVVEQAWNEGRINAFRGGEDESAALFSGRVFKDTQSPELFLCLEACLEAAHAVEDKLSVTFTGETWAQARQLLDLRRRRLNRPNEIILASVHRHPFLPPADATGHRRCAVCARAKYCGRSTAAPSTADFEWHRSVFSGQPWAALLIWGYNAREQEDFRLYGLLNASFTQRSIRMLKDKLPEGGRQ